MFTIIVRMGLFPLKMFNSSTIILRVDGMSKTVWKILLVSFSCRHHLFISKPFLLVESIFHLLSFFSFLTVSQGLKIMFTFTNVTLIISYK